MTLYIHGIGHFHPPNVIDNKFLESLQIETNDAWIQERVGILKRQTVLSLDYIAKERNTKIDPLGAHITLNNTETSLAAIKMALKRANLESDQVGMVIAGSCSPEYALPADACVIAGKLKLNVPAFDVNSACSTFASHLYVINSMRKRCLPDYILLVIADNTTRHINYNDRKSAVLWGDCSTAVIVSKKIKSNLVVDEVTFDSYPSQWQKITLPAGGYFTQDGPAVQRFAIKKMMVILKDLMQKKNLSPGEFYFIGHQANLRILQAVCKKLKIPPEKHLYNIDQHGNCGAAGAPSVLSQKFDMFKPKDVILLALVGAGLSWGGVVVRMKG